MKRPVRAPRVRLEQIPVPQGRCGTKLRWPSPDVALKALGHAQKRREWEQSSHMEKRAYKCPRCGGWHLTSKEKR